MWPRVGPAPAAGGAGYLWILQLGNAFCNSATPESVICVSMRLRYVRLVRSLRWGNPASVIGVLLISRVFKLPTSFKLIRFASVMSRLLKLR